MEIAMLRPNWRPSIGRQNPKNLGDRVSSEDVAIAVSGALRRSWGHVAGAAKRLGREIGATEEGARNLLDGRNAPRADKLIELMKRDDDVFRAVLELAGRADQAPQLNAQQLQAVKAMLSILDEGSSAEPSQ